MHTASYLAISMAPALQGVVQIIDGVVGEPGCIELTSPAGCRSDGDNIGDEKERR